MSNKRKRDRCKYHIIGQYFHSSSELCNFCIKDDIDGMGSSLGIIYYQYCPSCGEKITEQIKTYQMNNQSLDQMIKEERIKGSGRSIAKGRIPKHKRRISKRKR